MIRPCFGLCLFQNICCNFWHGSKTPWHLNSIRNASSNYFSIKGNNLMKEIQQRPEFQFFFLETHLFSSLNNFLRHNKVQYTVYVITLHWQTNKQYKKIRSKGKWIVSIFRGWWEGIHRRGNEEKCKPIDSCFLFLDSNKKKTKKKNGWGQHGAIW